MRRIVVFELLFLDGVAEDPDSFHRDKEYQMNTSTADRESL
jgi:hypothetical protein